MNEPFPPSGLLAKLAQAWPRERWRDVGVIVAVSGGPDSVALIRGLFELRAAGSARLVVAHFNHGLRSEANADERFVAELAQKLGLPYRAGRGSVGQQAAEQGDGIEAAARRARYEFLHETAHREGARYIATGHTADDQVETILHRIIRGTGLAGLGGMRRSRPLDEGLSLIRPLLAIRRREVLEYLAGIGQEFCTDLSNEDPSWTRNRLRGQLLPLLAEQFNPQIHEALVRLGRLAEESQEVLRALAEAAAAKCVVLSSDERVEVDLHLASGQVPAVLREMFVVLWQRQAWPLQAMGLAEWDRLAAAILAPASAQRWMLPGGILAAVEGQRLQLRRAAP